MTFRSRKLLSLAWEAPCFLQLSPTCGQHPSVPCHDDQLKYDRGVGHKSHDCFAISGCPDCHALFTRKHLGREQYDEVARNARDRYWLWMWTNNRIKVA